MTFFVRLIIGCWYKLAIEGQQCQRARYNICRIWGGRDGEEFVLSVLIIQSPRLLHGNRGLSKTTLEQAGPDLILTLIYVSYTLILLPAEHWEGIHRAIYLLDNEQRSSTPTEFSVLRLHSPTLHLHWMQVPDFSLALSPTSYGLGHVISILRVHFHKWRVRHHIGAFCYKAFNVPYSPKMM